jgi:16S rRNA (guanine527-N7)-methyltransferase
MTARRLEQGCAALGIPLDEDAQRRFAAFSEMLAQANAALDLTAVTDPLEIVDRHFLDSLTPLAQGQGLLPQGARVIDVGCGAGFPSVPLAIARPDLTFTLLDAQRKRLDFLNRVIEALGLRAVTLHARAEDAARLPEHREGYDLALARAVTGLPALLELTLPFVRMGGRALAWKGPAVEAELEDGGRAARLLGGELLPVLQAPVPGRDWHHLLVVAEKRGQTVRQYPRKAGEPGRKPLGILAKPGPKKPLPGKATK